MKQTSTHVSRLAGIYLSMPPGKLASAIRKAAFSEDMMILIVDDIRTLAASCLSQDEVKGIRKKRQAPPKPHTPGGLG